MTRATLILAWLAASYVLALGAAEPPNLVGNGDFSQAADGKPAQWDTSGDGKSVTQTLTVARDAAGKPYAQLVCTRCEKLSPASHAMLAQVGVVKLSKGKLYEFSCRARAEGLASKTVGVALQDTKAWTNAGLQDQMSVGEAWKSRKRVFRATQDFGATGRLQIWFSEPGTLCLADVRIVECAQEDVEFTRVIPPGDGKNLVFNGSFELGGSGWSSLGQGAGWGNLDSLHGTVQEGDAPHGRSFLRIPLGGENTPVLHFDYYEPIVRRELRPLAASVGWIKLEKGATYTLSCEMRASVEGTPAMIGVRGQDPAAWPRDYLLNVKLTTAWKRHVFTFKPEQRFGFVTIGPALTQDQRVDVDLDAVQLEKGEQATAFQPWRDVELALEAAQPAGVFVEGQPPTLLLLARNNGAAAAQRTVKLAVTDFEDKAVPLQDAPLEVPAGASARREIKLPAEWKGHYRVRAAEIVGGTLSPAFADVRLAIVPKRSASDSVCGINHAFVTGRLIELAAKSGVTWYRDWTLKWQHIEPKQGEWHWDVGDAQIDRVLATKMNVLPLLPPFPSAEWASEAPESLPTKGYPGTRIKQAWAPKNTADLANFIEKGVTRYKDRIHIWEFLNEPIYTDYALPADHADKYKGKKYTYADYVALLQPAAAAMKKADPSCKVIGGIAGWPREGTKEVIAAGILKHVDIFNLHIYPGARVPETFAGEMDAVLALMDASGGRKPIWMTEFSYYGADALPRKPFFPAPNSWSEERLLESEKQCADYTLRFFLTMLSHGVEKIFIHSGASGRVNDPNFECALFDYGGAPRKLFAALAVFTELLGPAPACAGTRKLGADGHAAAFECGKQSVVAVWREDEAATLKVSVPPADGTSWLDAMGRPLASPVTLGPSPAYLVGPAGKAKELLQAVADR
ncbi:MAG: endo-1,4-beta-xylanase [Planctomycetota bacterium]|nr:endo-1,4-beta-xylanase [Planctomycetota bacterium]